MRLFGLAGVLAIVGSAAAADVELASVFPAGGRIDSEFEVVVGGTLSDLTHAAFSGEGVKATLIGGVRDVTYTKKGKAVVSLVPNRFRFKITVDKDAKPGVRTFRVGTAYRLSEPLRFDIGACPEVVVPPTNKGSVALGALPEGPVSLNGIARAAVTNAFGFEAKRGACWVAFTESQVLPREAGRLVLDVVDATGKPCDGVSRHGDPRAPVVVFEVPQDGAYALRVASASRPSVYRIRFGELPLVTGFSPLGAKAGESLNVRLSGCNLPQRRVRLFTGGKNDALCLEALTGDACVLPGLRFDLSEDGDVDEKEPNGTAESAQALEAGIVVNGAVAEAGDRDCFRVVCKKGEALAVDVLAQSLGSALHPRVTVRDGRGAVAAAAAYETSSTVRAALCGRDPSLLWTPAEDGVYVVELSDADGRGGEAFGYRLRIGPPQPDYRLWMTPASLNIPSDGSALVTLHLERLHGFEGEVRVALDFPPLSISSEGGVIPAGATTAKMTVSTEGVRYPRTVFGLSLTGAATLGGREVRHTAVPVVFGASPEGQIERNDYAELSAKVGYGARAMRVDVLGKGGVPVDPRIPMPVVFKEPVGVGVKEPTRLTVLSATLATHLGGLYLPTVVWPPQGFVATGVQPTNKQERAGVLLRADPAVMKAGQTGYAVLGCYMRGDTNKTVIAVSQSVPYVVR